ncbi:MAG: hypothetical protein ACOH5I_16580 [Oligoflexus sp.]
MKRMFCFAALIVTTTSCSPGPEEQTTDLSRSEVPSSHRDYAIPGQAYNSDQSRFLNVACVTGDIVENLGNTEAQIELGLDLGFSEIIDRIGGKLSVDIDFPVVRAGASARYGQEMAASEHVNNYHFSWRATPKKQVLVPGSYRLTEVGERIASSSPADLFHRCGNEFVTAIEYGASLNVNLRMEFRNEQDKRDIGGKLKVSVGKVVDFVSVEGDLDYLDEEVKKSVKITVQAVQRGGAPLQLLKIIPNNLITCNLSNPEPCFQVFIDAVRYAKEDLTQQFTSLDSYNVIKYHTERYDESAIDSLVPPQSYPSLSRLVENTRMDLDFDFQNALLDQNRANRMKSAYREWLSQEQYEKIQDIEQKARRNARRYSQAAVFCYDNPNDECLQYASETQEQVEDYERDTLAIEAASVSDVFRCEYARLLAVEVGDVSARFALGYRNRGWAPIFFNNALPEEGVQSWVACSQALTTYGDYFKPAQ